MKSAKQIFIKSPIEKTRLRVAKIVLLRNRLRLLIKLNFLDTKRRVFRSQNRQIN